MMFRKRICENTFPDKEDTIMNSKLIFDKINQHLTLLAQRIKISNSLNLTEEANYSEDLYAQILNEVFDLKLKNNNERTANASIIDLYDEGKKVAVQVTSEKSVGTKYTSTKNNFADSIELHTYKNLIILFITDVSIPVKYLDGEVLSNKRKVIAIGLLQLLRKIKLLPLAKKKKILEVLDEEFSDSTGINKKIINISAPELKLLRPQTVSTNLDIDRNATIRELHKACESKHCLVIGKPGIGKSFLLSEFYHYCWKQNLISVFIPINELIIGSDEEISQRLNTKHNWLDYLTAYKGNKDCFLIFDAYDTAKDEGLKNNILTHINNALRRLTSNWKLIVSVREYDAYKADKLLQLFSNDRSADLSNCNRFKIEPLIEDEVYASLRNLPYAINIYQKCTKGLKEVLRIPYFLKIFHEIIKLPSHGNERQLKTIHTEEQLLHLFWQRKITTSKNALEKESIIYNLTIKLYEAEKLNIDKNIIVTSANANAISELISEGILIETGVYARNLAFSHNILFDYGIARQVIVLGTKEFIQQIDSNHKKPFIFRPSYVYFLNRLWQENKEEFWDLYKCIWNQKKAPFNIIHQVFFNSIVADSYLDVKDLSPLLELSFSSDGEILVFRFLNALRFIIQDNVRSQDIDLFDVLTKHINPHYLWILGYYIDKGFKSNKTNKAICTNAAIRYLEYILTKRKTDLDNKFILDYNGSLWGIINISQALQYNKNAAAKLIKETLEILNEDDFVINYFHRLTDEILTINKIDPGLASQVFTAIYLHNEKSDKETYLGSNVLISLKSNRKQDFQACYHRLEKLYPELLNTVPETALLMGIDLINKLKFFVFGEDPKIFPVKLFDVKGEFIPDGSIGYWDHEYEEGVGKLLLEMFKFLENKLKESENINDYLLIFYKNSHKSFTWKNIINFFKRHHDSFHLDSFELLQNDIFYLANETSYETSELLKSIIPHLSKSQLKLLEYRVTQLPKSNAAKQLGYSYVDDTVLTLLSCIPFESLYYSSSKKMIEQNGPRKNYPLVESGGDIRVSRNELIDPINTISDSNLPSEFEQVKIKLRSIKSTINNFDSSKGNLLSLSEAEKVMNEIQSLPLDEIRNSDEMLYRTGNDLILKALKILSKGWKTYPFTLKSDCLVFAQKYLNDKILQKAVYETGNRTKRAMFFIPNSRTEAAEIVMNLSNTDDLYQIASVVKQLITDNDNIVRSYGIQSLVYFVRNDQQEFWEITYSRLAEEKDDYCLMHLLQNLSYLDFIKEHPAEIEQALSIASGEIVSRNKESDFLKQYSELLFAAVYSFDSQIAKELAQSNFLIPDFTCTYVRKAIEWIERPLKDKSWTVFPDFDQFIFNELDTIIKISTNSLNKKGITHEEKQNFFSILDHLISRIHSLLSIHIDNRTKEDSNRLYFSFKPIVQSFLSNSYQIGEGLMIAHTGYYLIQLLEDFVDEDPIDVLKMLYQLTYLSSKTGFAGEQATLQITLRITEKYLAEYKFLILQDEHFQYLVKLLQIYVESGWQEALEFIWRLNEIL